MRCHDIDYGHDTLVAELVEAGRWGMVLGEGGKETHATVRDWARRIWCAGEGTRK